MSKFLILIVIMIGPCHLFTPLVVLCSEIPKIPDVPASIRKRQCSYSVGLGKNGDDDVKGQSDTA
jgi:hypothetical protein